MRTTPPLHLSGLPADIEREQGAVVVRISMSYRVTEDTVAEVIPAPLASIELGLDQPHVDAVTSAPQLWAYTRAFREMMDQIHQYLPRATGIQYLLCRTTSACVRLRPAGEQNDPSTPGDL